MRVLIDTNIFINRENYHVVPENLQQLLKMLNSLKVEVLIHPDSVEELRNDSDEARKAIGLSKIYTYSKLESPPNPIDDIAFSRSVGMPSNAHDKVDDALIYAVYRDAVEFLISEDKRLTSKALKVNLRNRVFSVDEAVEVFGKSLPKKQLKRPPALIEELVHNLNLRDTFFDSVREEYPKFDEWFRKVSREGRKCWVHSEQGSIRDLLIFKDENEPIDSVPPFPSKRRLKLCTFKATSSGHRIGELFIKLAVQYCVNNKIEQTYLTHYSKKEDPLAELLSEYGFFNVAKKDGEDIYLKELVPDARKAESMSSDVISTVFYPAFYDGPSARKFVVPIRPEYHDRLFTDYAGRQTTLLEHAGNFIVEGNTIKKAYLCHSSTQRISKGDILLFYRSKDRRELTTLGVVEDVFFRLKDSIKVMKLVGNRTVYSVEEIKELVKKPTLVLLFKWHFYLARPLRLDELKNMKILREAPQTLTRIPHKKYLEAKKAGGLDDRYSVDKARIL
jgi:predicted nucleic acid-binding protein